MATVTIRNIPDKTKETLRIRAAQSGVSLESYLRQILKQASGATPSKPTGILHLGEQYFGSKNGIDIELPERKSKRRSVDLNP